MGSGDAVVSYRKGLRTRFALVLVSSSDSATVLPVGETKVVVVDKSNSSKYSSVCYLKTSGGKGGSRPQLAFCDRSVSESLGIVNSSKPAASGFDEYPLVSRFGPALLILACRPTKAWDLADVMPHLASLAEKAPGGDGFNGRDRLFLDAARLGVDAALAPHVSIDPERQRWLSALAAAASGRFEQAFDKCSKLTPGAIVDRNIVVAAAMQSGDWSHKKANLLGALDDTSPGGALIAHVVDNKKVGRRVMQAQAGAVAEWISDKTESARAKRCIEGLSLTPLPSANESVFALSDSYRVATALQDRFKISQGLISDLAVDTVRGLRLEIVDELIERKAIIRADVETLVSARPRDAQYLALRLAPDTLSDEQLVGFASRPESLRREVIRCLNDDSHGEAGPGATLAKLRKGEAVTENEIESLPEDWKSTARRLSEFLTTGDVDQAAALADDPTLLSVISQRLSDQLDLLPRKGPLADLRASQNLRDSLRAVLRASWTDALDFAKEVMRCTEREDLRDEALNLMACAHWQLGNDDEAIGALRSALEGEYNSALQINVGVVASNLEPVIAAGHLGRLAAEAPSTKLRVNAAIRGIQLWSADLELDDESPVPSQLLDSLRSLVVDGADDQTLTDDEYWSVLDTLSVHDSEWLTTRLEHGLRSSTRGRMLDVAIARAASPVEYVEAVGRLESSTSPWCRQQRESITDMVLALQSHDPMSVFAAVMGMALLKTDISMPAGKGVRVRCLTLIGVCDSMDEDNEPSDEVQDYLKGAHGLMESCTPEEQVDLKQLTGFAGRALVVSVTSCRGFHIGKVGEAANNLATTLSGVPRRRLNMTAIRDAVRPMRGLCRDAISDLRRLRAYTDEEELLEFVDAVIAQASAITKFFDEATR